MRKRKKFPLVIIKQQEKNMNNIIVYRKLLCTSFCCGSIVYSLQVYKVFFFFLWWRLVWQQEHNGRSFPQFWIIPQWPQTHREIIFVFVCFFWHKHGEIDVCFFLYRLTTTRDLVIFVCIFFLLGSFYCHTKGEDRHQPPVVLVLLYYFTWGFERNHEVYSQHPILQGRLYF